MAGSAQLFLESRLLSVAYVPRLEGKEGRGTRGRMGGREEDWREGRFEKEGMMKNGDND